MAISSLAATMSSSLSLPKISPISAKPYTFPIISFPSPNFIPKPYTLSHSRVFWTPHVLHSEETLVFSPPEVKGFLGLDSVRFRCLRLSDALGHARHVIVTVEGLVSSSTTLLGVEDSADEIAPKQKIRIKLRSYWVPLIEDSCKQIMDAARTNTTKTMGPVPLPTKRRVYCVNKSTSGHKGAKFHFEIRTHQRLIDILNPTAHTIDSLMQLDLPAGVDVEVKL